jgi:hypothetical protein
MELPFPNVIHLRKNRAMPGIFDVDMTHIDQLKAYDGVECHIVLYPYSRQISSDDLAFYPFEEYIKDVASQQRSAYAAIRGSFNQVFGLSLGFLIALIFALLKPEELLSVESIVSVFGAYVIGKELWDDIERMLIHVSKEWRLRLQDSYYRYRLEKHTTLTSYSYLAKRQRYGKSSLLPEKIDFIKQSNSQTLRMYFNMQDLEAFAEPSAHVHSIHVDPALLDAFESSGFLFGVKLSLNKRAWGIARRTELFQSIDGSAIGCLDDGGRWTEGAVFYRHTVTCGRVKYYVDKGLVHGSTILEARDCLDVRDACAPARLRSVEG